MQLKIHDIVLLKETITGTKRVTLPKRTKRTLQRFLLYIKNSLAYTASNGLTKGISNKIKLINIQVMVILVS